VLWVRHFATVAELIDALRQFKQRYNEQWLIERHGYLRTVNASWSPECLSSVNGSSR
jgi:hypothetical protein